MSWSLLYYSFNFNVHYRAPLKVKPFLVSFNYNKALGSCVTVTTAYYTVLGCVPYLPCYGLFVDWKLFDFPLHLFEHVEGCSLQLKPLLIAAVKINYIKHSKNS